MTVQLQGAIALVTGGGSGIGAEIARAYHARGATLVLADLDDDGAAAVASELGSRAEAVHLDVTDPDAFEQVVGEVVERHGRIDVLVNSAGMATGGPAEELTRAQWRGPIEVNLMGSVNGIAAVFPRMAAQRSGHIVNVASLAGLAPAPLLVTYGASKWGVVGLSESLRIEAKRVDVGVSVLCPAAVDTPLLRTGGRGGSVHPRIDPVAYLEALGGPKIPASKVAAAAVRAIEKNRGVIVPGPAAIVWRLQRWFPGLVDAIATRQVAKHLKD